MDVEKIKATIEERHKEAAEAGLAFSQALHSLRSIEAPEIDKDNKEEVTQAMELSRDVDRRVAYLLRALLIQHGNVLFIL